LKLKRDNISEEDKFGL